MTENPTPENSPAIAQGSLQLDSVASPAASQTASEAPARPSWVSDEFYDPSKGVKFDELGARFKELSSYKEQRDAERMAREADIPQTVDGYADYLKDAQLADGFTLNKESEVWKKFQAFSHENKLTKSEFSNFVKFYADAAVSEQKAFMAKIEADKQRLFSELGDNGSQRIDAVNRWFTTTFGEKVGAQLAQTNFTPDIVRAWEKVQTALSNQGVTSFNGLGRDGAGGGDIEGWDKMTFEQRWNARSQADRRAN